MSAHRPLRGHMLQRQPGRPSATRWHEAKIASAGNRTRAARVAGEHSTTEPPMLVRDDSVQRAAIRERRVGSRCPNGGQVMEPVGEARARDGRPPPRAVPNHRPRGVTGLAGAK